MSILDQVTQMKNQGKSEQEIVQSLQSQGIPPQQIQDSLNQAQVKKAVQGTQTAGMRQSIMSPPQETQEPYLPQNYSQDYPQQTQQYSPQYPTEQNYSQGYSQEQYPQEYSQDGYSQKQYPQEYSQDYYQDPSGNFVEIAEQVIEEKTKKINSQIEDLQEFKALANAKLATMEERLKRVEYALDKLQASILEKIGSYGKNLSSIKKEMSMMQDSFSKVINPILDKKRKK